MIMNGIDWFIHQGRQLSKTISQDSEVEESPQMNKSRKKAGQETPTSKAARSRRAAAAVESVVDESVSVQELETTGPKKRTRRVKNSEVSDEQSILLDNSVVNDSRVEKARGTRSRKRPTKKEDSKSEDESGEARGGKRKNGLVGKNASIMELNNEAFTNAEMEEVPMSREDAEVQRALDRSSRGKSAVSTPSSPRSAVKRRGRQAKPKLEDTTPESSPITVNLTPHRTTKTPRKSPMNFGSPKSHAELPLRLTKTPRKLPVVIESPAGSEKSIDSSINGTPKKSPKNSSVTGTKTSDGHSARKKKRSPKKKSPIKTPRKSPSKDLVVRKFSKSPKIVLATPKGKSPKGKSPRVVASKAKKSPVPKSFAKSPPKSKSPRDTNNEAIAEKVISPASPEKINRSKSLKKSVTPSSALKLKVPENNLTKINSPSNRASPRTSRNTSPVKNAKTNDQTSSPMVVFDKIPNNDVVTPEEAKKSWSRRSNNAPVDDSLKVTPIKSPSAEKRISQGGESPRRLKSAVKKRTPITDSGTPLRPIPSSRTSSTRTSIVLSIGSEKNTPIEIRTSKGKIEENNVRMLSSTPRERIRRSLNLSPYLGTPLTAVNNSPINDQPVGSSTLIAETRATRSMQIEDITNPLISEDDDSISLVETSKNGEETHLDGTFEIAKKTILNAEEGEAEKTADGTYELMEPKTPVLRRKAGKRSIAELDTSIEERTTKRACRVRFASPPPNPEEGNPRVTGRAKSATPGQRVAEKRFTPGSNKVTNQRTGNRKRSNSLTDVSTLKTPIPSAKRRSNSTTETNFMSANRSAQIASVNRLSKPRLSIHQSNKKTGNHWACM